MKLYHGSNKISVKCKKDFLLTKILYSVCYTSAVTENQAKIKEEKMKVTNKYSAYKVFTVQIMLIAIAIIFVCTGVYRGEVETVLTKAIRLCLECVGIG